MEEIEEIDADLEGTFFADAMENERVLAQTEEQKKNYTRVIIFWLYFFLFSVKYKHSSFESVTFSGGFFIFLLLQSLPWNIYS